METNIDWKVIRIGSEEKEFVTNEAAEQKNTEGEIVNTAITYYFDNKDFPSGKKLSSQLEELSSKKSRLVKMIKKERAEREEAMKSLKDSYEAKLKEAHENQFKGYWKSNWKEKLVWVGITFLLFFTAGVAVAKHFLK